MTSPQHGRSAAGPARATLVLRALAVVAIVVAVAVAAAMVGRGADTATIEPPPAVTTGAPSPAASNPTPLPSASPAEPTATPSARPTAKPSPTRTTEPRAAARPSSAPARSPGTRAEARPKATPKATPKPTPRPEPSRTSTTRPTQEGRPGPRSLVDEIVTLTNAERVRAGLPRLAVSSCATKQAASRTAVLVAQDRFEHDPLGPVVEACGTGTVGENLALGYTSAKATVAGWMGSPGHKANILGTQYTKIGVGCTQGPRGPLCAQVFLG
ncbi:CAP domain-containing protein [Cellulomonas edaphi]|uniref:CAP domain-containing protein n=1 Tax=Cellulomonas edaphi TaxID=3053468 RepID=A0ABT7S3I4_9CELL|nr:CAP domain-containing protein [Cellulomons edaphi]MDM7830188.1 CAP domain-containing protein [Cellulomons edaphi]